jgi:hypothetical protein
MAVFNLNKAVLGTKIESTAGTAESLVNGDFDVRVYDIEMSIDVEMHSRKYARGHHGRDLALVGARYATINFVVHLADSGAVATAPAYEKLLQSCGLKETAYTTTGISWTRDADYDCKTLTLEVRDLECAGGSQKIYKFKGAMGNVVMSYGASGEPIQMAFEYTGIFTGEDEELSTPLLGTGFDTTVPPNMLGIDITFGSQSLRTNTFEFNLGNTVELLRSQGGTEGFLHAMIADTESSITLDPKLDLVATDGLRVDHLAGTARTLTIPVKASAPELTLTVTAAQVTEIQRADAEGSVTREVTFGIVDTDGASNLEILQGSKT